MSVACTVPRSDPKGDSAGDPPTVWGWLTRAPRGSRTWGPLCEGKMNKHPHFPYYQLLPAIFPYCSTQTGFVDTQRLAPRSPQPHAPNLWGHSCLCASPPSSAAQELNVAGEIFRLKAFFFFFPKANFIFFR